MQGLESLAHNWKIQGRQIGGIITPLRLSIQWVSEWVSELGLYSSALAVVWLILWQVTRGPKHNLG